MKCRSHSGHEYPSPNYDGYLCLKPPLLLWGAVLYLTRAITLPVAMAIGSFAGVNADAIALVRRCWNVDSLLPAAFAVTILYALGRRVPTAGQPVRWIWARGQILLSVSAALDLALASLALFRSGGIDEQLLVTLASAALDLYFLAYLLGARRVRDTFCEFPPPELAPKAAGT